MRERSEQLLKLACALFAALLLLRVVWAALHLNPVANLAIPAVPTFQASETNLDRGQTGVPGTLLATNRQAPGAVGQNTNARPHGLKRATELANSGTNARAPSGRTISSNLAMSRLPPRATNDTRKTALTHGPTLLAKAAATNETKGANSRPGAPGLPLMARGGPAVKLPELPAEILARVDRVTDSQLLGPVFHPLPMALLGIAGDIAFLRSPSGQTGLVKEGEAVAGIKLLKIGINRVLVEEDGQKKELTIFGGFGGESLLPK